MSRPPAACDRPAVGSRVVVKDNISVVNLLLTCGSNRVAVVPDISATVASRLLNAGAALVDKANMDAFAFGPSGEFSDYDSVENPAYPDRVPGGSSSGSGAAVASGEADFALGSDTSSLVRISTAACGVVGMNPHTHSSHAKGSSRLPRPSIRSARSDTISKLSRRH